jgi:hypothetical protein
MHLELVGEKTIHVYEALGRQPLPQNGTVEYEELDDRLTVKATVENGRSITLTQHYGGAAECFLARTDSGVLIKSSMDDVDVGAVLKAIREAIGPQSPTPPNANPVSIV